MPTSFFLDIDTAAPTKFLIIDHFYQFNFSLLLPTLAAENQGRQGEDQGRGQEDQQPEHRKYANNLTWQCNDNDDNANNWHCDKNG